MDVIKCININGFSLMSGNFLYFKKLMADSISDIGEKSIFFHINLYNYYNLIKEQNLSESIIKNSFLFLDGIAMKIGCFLLGKGYVKDINGTDLFPLIMKELNKSQSKVYLLGSGSETLQMAIKKIKQIYKQIDILGFHSGYFDDTEEILVVNEINHLKPDILIIGMGILKEAEFINRNISKINIKCIWNVGGLFDFISGKKPRAPKWIRRIRFEWFFRFILEPKRMFFRYFIIAFWFIIHLFKIRLSHEKTIL